MEDNILNLIIRAKSSDEDALLTIITKFKPLIKKYSRLLNYDTAETDLIIELIVLIKKMSTDKKNLQKDNEFIAYIASSIKYQYYKLLKERKYLYNEIVDDELIQFTCVQVDFDLNIYIENLLDKLTTKEKFILTAIYFYGYKEVEISRKLNISRQAINKIKKNALNKLSKTISTE